MNNQKTCKGYVSYRKNDSSGIRMLWKEEEKKEKKEEKIVVMMLRIIFYRG
jgi:hypothetical protein